MIKAALGLGAKNEVTIFVTDYFKSLTRETTTGM
jgi:hypothetical protein